MDLTGNPKSRIFHSINQQSPDVWTWIGDIVYLPPGAENETHVINSYNYVKNNPLYSQTRKQTKIIGVWDDHDYGQNNGDKYYIHKERNKQIFLDFFDEPKTSHRRTRDGVYEAYYLGHQKRVKIILIDVRYNRDARFSLSGDMLGETQWQWLENELKNNSADFTLIASGSQIIPDDRLFTETWYDSSREKLLGLIRKHKVSGVILLSGDVHFAEILTHPCPERVGYPNFYEFTSSGLTQYPPVPEAKKLLDKIFPSTFNEIKDRYFVRNFAMIRFDFEGKEPKAMLEVRGEDGKKILEKEIYASELRYEEDKVNLESKCVLDESGYWRFARKAWGEIQQGDFWVFKYPVIHARYLLRLGGMRRKHAAMIGGIVFLVVGCLIGLFFNRKKLLKFAKRFSKNEKRKLQ